MKLNSIKTASSPVAKRTLSVPYTAECVSPALVATKPKFKAGLTIPYFGQGSQIFETARILQMHKSVEGIWFDELPVDVLTLVKKFYLIRTQLEKAGWTVH